MALQDTQRFGAVYEFGIDDATAPSIPGFKVRKMENKFSAEVEEKVQNGEGAVESVVTTKPDRRMITTTLTGPIHDIDAYLNATSSFEFRGRFFIISGVSEPREKGKTVEGTVEAYSHYNVTSAS